MSLINPLTIYPNPSKDIINVSVNSGNASTEGYVADIYSTSGTLIKHESVTAATWSDDVSAFNLGIYIIQVKDSNGKLIGQAKFSKIN